MTDRANTISEQFRVRAGLKGTSHIDGDFDDTPAEPVEEETPETEETEETPETEETDPEDTKPESQDDEPFPGDNV